MLDFDLVAHGPGDRRSQLAAGDGVSGKAEARELRKGFTPVCNTQQGGGEIGQIGPFVRHVEGPGVGHAATAELLRDHEIEPRSMSAPIKVPRAHNDDTHTALGRLGDAVFDRHAQLSLARRCSRRGILVDHGRQR